MIEGERFVGNLPVKKDFHDRSKRRSYDVTRRVAAPLIDDPALVENGRAYLERYVRPDPAQARYHELWIDLLRQDVRQIVRQMLADTSKRPSAGYPAGLRRDSAQGALAEPEGGAALRDRTADQTG